MGIENGLLIAKVMHARQKPRRNAFVYNVYYLCFALSDLAKIACSVLSLNRFNLFSFRERDHGKCDGSSNEAWIKQVLVDWAVPQADGKIILVTLPRVMGYAFNPVSFWFCLDKEGRLRAVLSEVNNTFGERHCYLSYRDDREPITKDDKIKGQKIFHVSPFLKVVGGYEYRFAYAEDQLGIWIDYYDQEGLMLMTAVTGKRIPLTTANLLYCFFRYPMVTFKVIGLIHYQAVRLLFKGIKYQPKPLPPVTEISR